jgi:large subunit ribosomal protein L30e
MARKKAAAADAATIQKAIRMCLDSGKVLLGANDASKQAMHGKGKLIVLASNMPANEASDIRNYCQLSDIPVLEFAGTSIELGSVCGKPFPVSAMWIGEVGNSPIMNFVAKK